MTRAALDVSWNKQLRPGVSGRPFPPSDDEEDKKRVIAEQEEEEKEEVEVELPGVSRSSWQVNAAQELQLLLASALHLGLAHPPTHQILSKSDRHRHFSNSLVLLYYHESNLGQRIGVGNT